MCESAIRLNSLKIDLFGVGAVKLIRLKIIENKTIKCKVENAHLAREVNHDIGQQSRICEGAAFAWRKLLIAGQRQELTDLRI